MTLEEGIKKKKNQREFKTTRKYRTTGFCVDWDYNIMVREIIFTRI
jgi:hypothetical protein